VSKMAHDRPTAAGDGAFRSRRRFLIGAAVLGTAAAAGGARWLPRDYELGRSDYEDAARDTWRHTAATDLAWPATQRELVRYATLAASNHNSQPWRFRLRRDGIVALPEFSRYGPVEDYDGHELFVSLGCAIENIVQAAGAFGLRASAQFDPRSGGTEIALERAMPRRTDLFEAIPRRQTMFASFDGTPVRPEYLRLLEGAATGDSVRVLLFTQPQHRERILDHVLAAIDVQMDDANGEFMWWVRFNYRRAVASRDGVFVKRFGQPSAPDTIGRILFNLCSGIAAQKQAWTAQVRSSASIAVIITEHDDAAHWIEAGRCGQRLSLQATALGMQSAFMCHPLEARTVIPRFAADLGIAPWSPVAMIRFGHGRESPLRSLRRPVEQVIVAA
jgi:nitroreductase